MNSNNEMNVLEYIINSDMGLRAQVDVLFDILKNILDEGTIRARSIRHRMQKNMKSDDEFKRLYALNKIASDGRGLKEIPTEANLKAALEDTYKWFSEELARKYVQNKIEGQVEQYLVDKQDKYIDEVRLGIIKKQKGPENDKTKKKYEKLMNLDARTTNKSVMSLLRPSSFEEIIGQERAIKSLISKLASPYPQHVILYGPPGVGKTTAARLALEEAKKLEYTPFDEESKFVEVDGATLRWDPREITNPLLGSVHDPIYQGSKRDLAETGIPEPKTGLVTEAHGGVLFIDEIGELDDMLQNKLLKVLEDKRVQFSSSYYDPDDENIPQYIRYLFEKGAPADFILIGATTRSPQDINPAIRSRCTEVFFEPLSSGNIKVIVQNAAKKLEVTLENGIADTISNYTIEGRKAVNILADAYAYSLYKNDGYRSEITKNDLEDVLSIGRYTPYEILDNLDRSEVGHVYGLGVAGFLGSTIEIETAVFKAQHKGKGTVRFNDTAGSMAKDSVVNAASVIRKVTDIDIKDYDVHVNVIGGGNIDVPSAGTAITICIISALLDKPIKQDVAITGEISLRGNVKPVGGIFEKIYGAKRKGIKLVIVPEDNKKDVPRDLEDIEVKTVSHIEEVMKIVFDK